MEVDIKELAAALDDTSGGVIGVVKCDYEAAQQALGREMVDREHPVLSTVRQCTLLDISRSSLY